RKNAECKPPCGVAQVGRDDNRPVVEVLVSVIGPTCDRAEIRTPDCAVRQRIAIASGHNVNGSNPAIPPWDTAIFDVNDMASGYQRMWTDEPGGANPSRSVLSGDQ